MYNVVELFDALERGGIERVEVKFLPFGEISPESDEPWEFEMKTITAFKNGEAVNIDAVLSEEDLVIFKENIDIWEEVADAESRYSLYNHEYGTVVFDAPVRKVRLYAKVLVVTELSIEWGVKPDLDFGEERAKQVHANLLDTIASKLKDRIAQRRAEGHSALDIAKGVIEQLRAEALPHRAILRWFDVSLDDFVNGRLDLTSEEKDEITKQAEALDRRAA
jgi:hypothetical protein